MIIVLSSFYHYHIIIMFFLKSTNRGSFSMKSLSTIVGYINELHNNGLIKIINCAAIKNSAKNKTT